MASICYTGTRSFAGDRQCHYTRSALSGNTKRDFYEGAALFLLARNIAIGSIRYEAPCFVLNETLVVYLKYSTKGRSPWSFTITTDEHEILETRSSQLKVVVGLVCGADGVAAVAYPSLAAITGPSNSAAHLACYRRHNEHYRISGPLGELPRKVAPSDWLRVFDL